MIGNIRTTAWIAICLLLVVSTVCLADDSVRPVSQAVEEINFQESLNRATADVLNARFKLEDWKLARLQVLRESGFATWLEVARQQLLVDTLGKQGDALQEFAGFTRALRKRALIASETALPVEADASPRRTAAPMRISLPGSVRLVGWIENPQGLVLCSAGVGESVAFRQEFADELNAATENLARAEKRCSGLSAGGSAPEQWRQNAELQLAVAQAELQLVRLKHNLLNREPKPPFRVESVTPNRGRFDDQWVNVHSHRSTANTTLWAGIESLSLAELNNSVTAGSHRDLREATLEVAAAEASATGELQSAEIELQRFELRLQALQKLHEQGFADRIEADLDAARRKVAAAVLRIELLRGQQENFKQAYQFMQSSPEASPTVVSGDSANSSSVETWPLPILTDVEFVRHLLELRRESCAAVAQREALALKLAMLERSAARLETIAEESASDSSQSQHAVGLNDLKSHLREGLRREMQSLQLDLRHAGALRLTAEERLNILALEERRFMLQCLAQQNTRGQSGGYSNTLRFVGLNLVDGSSTNRVVLSGFQQPQPARYSYFESRDFESRESPLEIVFWRATDPGCTLADYPGGIRPFAVPSGTVCRSSIRIGGNPGACSPYRPLSANRLSYDAVDDKPRNARFDPPEQRDHLGSRYERAYPFGILRADLRSQQPVGFVPWYLPGSPTNYPYPNNR